MNRTLKATAAIMLMSVVLFAVGCKKDKVTGDGTISGHTYVDLGLPSGTLWAACNVGANSPEEYGDYFAWGETQPKDRYNWRTYNYCYCDNDNGIPTFTKYCRDSDYGYNGFIDNLTILQNDDDAASANWGDNWNTPTQENWEELINNTAHMWTVQNGVYGRLFTSTNGSSLFLPTGGSRHEGSINSLGNWGCYWSSSFGYWQSSLGNTYYNEFGACHFYFSSQNIGVSNNCWRSDGYTIRPVCSR